MPEQSFLAAFNQIYFLLQIYTSTFSSDVNFPMFTLITISALYVHTKEGVSLCMVMQDKVQKELSKINSEEKDQILENFNRFKQYLSDKVELGENMGLSEEKLAKTTELVANYLATHEEPRNREENLLMELWKSGSKEEQHMLSHMLLEMVRKA